MQIYTATNAKARKVLNDTLVSDIAMKWRISFGPNKYSNAHGLLRIINDYRLAIVFLLLLVCCAIWLYEVVVLFVSKTIPDIFSCNSRKHFSLLIIFVDQNKS